MTVASEMGYFKEYENKYANKKDILDGILLGLRLRGCSISTDEIDEIIKIEKNRIWPSKENIWTGKRKISW